MYERSYALLLPSVTPTFSRLFATLGCGVGAVTLILWLVDANPVLDVTSALLMVLLFSGVVMPEAGRLLADEGPDD
jgi:hypothetical protein